MPATATRVDGCPQGRILCTYQINFTFLGDIVFCLSSTSSRCDEIIQVVLITYRHKHFITVVSVCYAYTH